MKLYSIPFRFSYNKYIKDLDLNNLELFKYIEIETVNRCNGTCSFCPVNAALPQRPFYKMKEELFHKIIGELEELDYSGELRLYSNNEPFLDDRILEFARYAREHVVNAFICIYTNGTLLSVENVSEICNSLDMLVIDDYSEDGVKISERLKPIIDYCRKEGLLGKKVRVFTRKRNEVLTTRGGQAPNTIGLSKKQQYPGCFLPFKQMVIRPDGKCSLCCNDALGKYTLGDTNRQTLVEIWNSDIYQSVRTKMISGGRNKLKLCDKCDTHIIV